MIPSPGRIVHYRLSASDAASISKRRTDARTSGIAAQNSGAIVHTGNPVREGDVFPLLVTRVFDATPTEASTVNGQVFLDGNDSLWITSRKQGYEIGQWSDPRSAHAG